jgi:hypothetical protein
VHIIEYSILLSALAAGCTSQDDEVDRYVAARTANQRAFDSLRSNSAGEALKIDSTWVAEYGPRLRQIIGPVAIAGLSDSAKMNIGSMSCMYENDALPDGSVYLVVSVTSGRRLLAAQKEVPPSATAREINDIAQSLVDRLTGGAKSPM